jgi:large subunit ribosomal protein L4
VDAPKTKLFLQKVKDMGVSDSLLLITDELDDNLVLSSRNLPNVLVLEVAEADPVSLIRYKNVILTRKAVSKFEEMLG